MAKVGRDGTSPGDRGAYAVGYGRPPKEHRFRAGQCANPHGRRGKGAKAPARKGFLDEVVGVIAQPNGRRRPATRDELIDHALFARAKDGDVAAIKYLDERVRQRDAEWARRAAAAADAATADARAFERFMQRELRGRRLAEEHPADGHAAPQGEAELGDGDAEGGSDD